MKRIVIDIDIPYIDGVFEPFFDEVIRLKGSLIKAEHLASAEALIIRTRTRADASLLANSSVRVIATATIGTDHIDSTWCAAHGIELFSASGCNARAVAQWVLSAVHHAGIDKGVIGIVGVGNVGREVEAMARARGFSILRNDPPRALREGGDGFVSIEELLGRSDVVTIHTPLDNSTRDMVNANFLEQIRPRAMFLNSSRGEVVDEEALINSGLSYALDVWRNEPHINIPLMERALIATPHIAGYSARGKARATEMSVRWVARFLGITELTEWQVPETFALEEPENYDILSDDHALRSSVERFEQLRRIRPM